MTLQIGERITIDKFIEKLQTIQFNKITTERIGELFAGYSIQMVNKVREDLIDIGIDDYIFTVSNYSEDEGCFNGFIINETIRLSSNVEVWLPSDSKGSNDITADGTIKRAGDSFYLSVNYTIN